MLATIITATTNHTKSHLNWADSLFIPVHPYHSISTNGVKMVREEPPLIHPAPDALQHREYMDMTPIFCTPGGPGTSAS